MDTTSNLHSVHPELHRRWAVVQQPDFDHCACDNVFDTCSDKNGKRRRSFEGNVWAEVHRVYEMYRKISTANQGTKLLEEIKYDLNSYGIRDTVSNAR